MCDIRDHVVPKIYVLGVEISHKVGNQKRGTLIVHVNGDGFEDVHKISHDVGIIRRCR